MSLNQYKEKRNFNKTPEPSGKYDSNKFGGLRFVVQKHDATRLHYDLRLELNGTLKSWAVPKGPSLNPSDKRMAKMVEDHPVDYQNFEGIIPEGNYGAGPVIVWDNGTYKARESTSDLEEMENVMQKGIEKGHISFVLDGKKLKGEFTLVRMNKADDTWLLIKKNDEFASTSDVTKESRSVLSNKEIEEVSEDLGLSGTPSEDMPDFIKPMYADTAEKIFDDPQWIYEIKWDGYRTEAAKNGKDIKLYSRKGIRFGQFGAIESELNKLNHSLILDGEMVVLDENGRAQFQLLQDYQLTRRGNLVYYVFDILHLDGHNLRNLPLLRRKEILKKVLPELNLIRYSDHVQGQGQEFFRQVLNNQIEGILAKKGGSQYLPGRRTSSWQKIKILNRQEAVICGFTAPRSGRQNFGALVLGVYENGALKYIGHTGSGFDENTLKFVHEKLKLLVKKKSPFEKIPETNEKVTWVRPELVCEIEFQEWTADGIARTPIFLGLRDDKDAAECHLERSERSLYESKPTEIHPQRGVYGPRFARNDNGVIKKIINSHELILTNLEKVYWPDEGYTKGDLINYYREISKYIMPHLKDRPESLLRQPNGIGDKGFWHKNIENLPEWINKIQIYSESQSKTTQFLICNDEASLVYMINLGCIEIHPWFSRVKSLEKPNFMVFDLDPEDIDFDRVIETALILKQILDIAEIPSYCKTSGSRGLHVIIPLGGVYSYETVTTFAKIIAILAQKKSPEIISLERNPGQRQKRVYIDYLQNGKGKTIAAPYSVRAKPGAPVSTPLKWQEVTYGLNPKEFNMYSMVERLKKVGDIFAPVVEEKIDIKKAVEKLSTLI